MDRCSLVDKSGAGALPVFECGRMANELSEDGPITMCS